jgi:hypothetical protein
VLILALNEPAMVPSGGANIVLICYKTCDPLDYFIPSYPLVLASFPNLLELPSQISKMSQSLSLILPVVLLVAQACSSHSSTPNFSDATGISHESLRQPTSMTFLPPYTLCV